MESSLNAIKQVSGSMELSESSKTALIADCVSAITKQIRDYEAVFDERRLLGTIIGVVFEQVARNYLIDNPGIFPGQKIGDALGLLALLRQQKKRNPDFLVYTQTTDEITISAVLEMKFDAVDDTKYRATNQLERFGQNIANASHQINDSDTPTKVAVPATMDVYLVHPSEAVAEYPDIKTDSDMSDKVRTGVRAGRNCKYIFLPISRKKIEALSRAIQNDVVSSLPEDVRYWITPNDWVD